MGSVARVCRDTQQFELRFFGLRPTASDFAVPCDASGAVDIDGLSGAQRIRYLFARAVVGWEYRVPTVCPVAV